MLRSYRKGHSRNTMKSNNRPTYFTKLELENIRSFGGLQCLDLLDEQDRPARWTVILGDNGVGKTTLLQCLTRMRPVFNEAPDEDADRIPTQLSRSSRRRRTIQCSPPSRGSVRTAFHGFGPS